MSIESKTKCGQDIINTQERIDKIKRHIDIVNNGIQNKDFSATLDFTNTKRGHYNLSTSYYDITKEDILTIINRTLKIEEDLLEHLNEQYKTID
jgi:hypothetical protein